ncbi:hypothetical protein Q0Z83_047650 [Actinoplanes sichuanensis]|uniref:Uncharacterized protein n=1 Tax=Actinoplanes sichuanensis TaxID=512349 RepID=A0ABW4AQH0_9ACTN|nr:hypothetical protein [Actinoplanes sichuanensis]BEL06574.1 hypothetical protein Q0Z83_047650 [Actinoplanes sichuanensis]
MGDLVADLHAPDVHRNPRLKALQDLLSQLVRKLDDEKVLVHVDEDRQVVAPGWIARSA